MNGKVSRWFVAAFAAAMCPLFAVADGGLTDGYAKMVSIRVSDSLVAENVTLTDFPVLVRLGSNISGFSYDDFVLSDGADLLFTDEDGTTRYPHEVAVWSTTGESLVWVKLPSLSRGTKFAMWYGNASAEPAADSASAWSSYRAVYHLDEGAETFACADATTNNFTGTARSHTQGHSSDGKIGGYRDNWANGDNDPTGIVLPAMTTMQLGNAFTFSTWLRRGTGSHMEWDHILMCNSSFGDCTDNGGVLVMLNGGSDVLFVSGSGTAWGSQFGSADGFFDLDGRWNHFAITIDGNSVACYLDGSLKASGTMGGAVTERDLALCIGALSSETGANPWRGDFDEARLRAGVSSADWVNAEYVSMSSAASLLYSPAVSPGVVLPSFAATPTCTCNADGTVVVSAALSSSGAGATIYAVFGGDVRREIGIAAAGGSASKTFQTGEIDGFADDFECLVVAVGESGEVAMPADVTVIRPVAAPVVTRAFAINGHLNVWVEDFTSNVSDYVLQRREPDGVTWTTYTKVAVGSNDGVTNHPFGPNIYSPDPSLRGMTHWRIAAVAHPDLWREFDVDARLPLAGTPVCMTQSNDNGVANAFDGKSDTYYLINAEWWSMYVGLDLGEEKTIRQIAYLPNGGKDDGVYVEIADNASFENSTRVRTLSVSEDLDRTRIHVITFDEPITTRFIRLQSAYTGYFSVWEFEVSEGVQVFNDDFATGYPTVRFAADADSPTDIYAARKANGSYQKVATVPAGTASWTDTTLAVGEVRWYKVGRCIARGARIRRIERDPLDETILRDCTVFSACDKPFAQGGEPEMAFDGNLATTASVGPVDGGTAEESGNPALGVAFADGKAAFVEKCRVYCVDNPWWTYMRMAGVTVYGSNDELDPVGSATAISEPLPSDLSAVGGFYREWIDIPCRSTESFKYVFLRLPDGVRDSDPWRGNAAEIQFYGWSEKDVAKPGLAIIVR